MPSLDAPAPTVPHDRISYTWESDLTGGPQRFVRLLWSRGRVVSTATVSEVFAARAVAS